MDDDDVLDNMSEESVEEAAAWKAKIARARQRDKRWHDQSKRILKRYRDERGDTDSRRKFNVLWSNVQTIKPALYSRTPVPICERRFLDKDPIGRTAAMIMERALRYEIEDNGFHEAVDKAVFDRLLPGRGTAWVRFEPTFRESLSLHPEGDSELSPELAEEEVEEHLVEGIGEYEEQASEDPALVGARVLVDYVHWQDLFISDARTWEEVEWIARQVYMNRSDLVERFGPELGKQIGLDHTPEEKDGSGLIGQHEPKATVYEIWCKYEREVVFVAEGYPGLIQKVDDPLKLDGFFPMPRPLYATLTNDSLTPVPDFKEYQDQANELDSLTDRCAKLEKALKVAGVYDSSAKGLQRLMEEGADNTLVPVENWTAFAEKGGIAGAISFLPIKEVAAVLAQLYQAREIVKRDLYEITGISDIVRGQSDPRETASAQQIKSNFGSQRISASQADVARFARDLIRIMGEIIAEHFPTERIMEISSAMHDEGIGAVMSQPMGAPATPSPVAFPGAPGAPAINPMAMQLMQMQQKRQIIDQAIALLRDEKQRGFRIDLETDSTIANEAAQDKQATVEFVTSATGFLQQAATMAQMDPTITPLLGKMMLFAIRRFRAGRDLENSFEEYIDEAQKRMTQAAQNPQESPKDEKAKAEVMKASIEAQAAQQKALMDQQEREMDFRLKEAEAQARLMELQREGELKAMEHQMRMREIAAKTASDLAQAIQPQPQAVVM